MDNWISALATLQNQGEPCVLVTIIEELGSTPRNAGSSSTRKMVSVPPAGRAGAAGVAG